MQANRSQKQCRMCSVRLLKWASEMNGIRLSLFPTAGSLNDRMAGAKSAEDVGKIVQRNLTTSLHMMVLAFLSLLLKRF